MEIPLLKDVVIIFGLSIAVLLICHRLKLPTLVGFLITGILAGPHGLGLIKAVEEVKILAEIGIVLLLFTVGLEFSLKKILEYKRYFILAGPIQVGLTICLGFLGGMFAGSPLNESIFLGFLVSLSSTAIVIRILQERAESSSPHGQISLGILIFQDIVVVLMMLVTPFLAGVEQEFKTPLSILLIEGVLILGLTFFSAIKLVPKLLYYVARTRSRELFLLTVLVICFGVAWVTSSIGLSLALGAFLAGLVISESEYSNQAVGDIIPFQDIFTSFFFVSIGMLLDLDFFWESPFMIVFVTISIILMKSLVVACTALLLGLPLRTAVIAALSLCQVGEFSFVLAMTGISSGIGSDYHHQLFIAVAVMTMGVTPTLITLAPKIANWILLLPFSMKIESGMKKEETKKNLTYEDHLIIVGYGFTGRNLARSSREAEVPYVIIDMNPETVKVEKSREEPIYFGDATRDRVLKHVNIEKAKVVAVVINDPIAALRIVEHARKMNPTTYIVVRTRYLEEMKPLYQLGADEVIPDELGSSVEIFTRVLLKYEVQQNQIEQLVNVLRTEGYDMLRPRYTEETIFSDLKDYLDEVGVKTFVVGQNSIVAGRQLKDIQMRNKYGLTVLLVKRGQTTFYNIEAETILNPGDKVVVVGTKAKLAEAYKLFS